MNKKHIVLLILISIFITTPAFCKGTAESWGISEKQYKELTEFSKKMHKVKEKFEKGIAFKKDVKEIIGDPAFILKDKSDWTIQVEGQKDEWQYWHPCYATVSYIFIFAENDMLIMISCRQLQNPANSFIYYDVDYFLE